MAIRLYRAYTPSTRNRTVSTFSELTRSKPEKSLVRTKHNPAGHNNHGVITDRNRGGRHKKRFRLIDFKRKLHGIYAKEEVVSGSKAPYEIGNALPIGRLPLGTAVHNVELIPGRGAQIVRAAGTAAQIIAKDNNYVTLKLPSSEIRQIHSCCYATIGQIGNIDACNITIGKAGRNRWLGKKPHVRGVAKNPVDHPHGGGEGRSPIG